jgi:hypothetical protein
MPRRSRRDMTSTPARSSRTGSPLDLEALAEKLAGPSWARVDGVTVRPSRNDDKRYRCPYCEGWIEPGTPHLVVIPEGRLDERRHYHKGCWSKSSANR